MRRTRRDILVDAIDSGPTATFEPGTRGSEAGGFFAPVETPVISGLAQLCPRFRVAVAATLPLLLGTLAGPALAGGSVVINEIGYAASGAAGEGTQHEYIELFNPYSVPADITGWTIGDDSIPNLFTFPSLVVPAHAFVVVYGYSATGTVTPDADVSDGSAAFIASIGWAFNQYANTGDGVILEDPFGILDFVYYDESNTGDIGVDADAVIAGMWKEGAAIDTVEGLTLGRAIALRVDGQAPNEINPDADAEDLDWMQYDLDPGGTPGTWNDPATIFKDAFESGLLGYWSMKVTS